MANLFDYLACETATFDEKPFCPLDSAVLSQLAMVDIDGIVPAPPTPSASALARLAAALAPVAAPVHVADIAHAVMGEERCTGLAPHDVARCLRAAADTPRFSGLEVRYCRSVFDEDSHTQFAACTFVWRDAFAFVAYRGTDDTLVGWRENLDMAYKPPVVSQGLARAYLEEVAPCLPDNLYAGGHSKGGNLALYAALTCSDRVRRRLVRIWCHDAPGFKAGLFAPEAYLPLSGRIHRTVPRDSIVGVLLECPLEPQVVASSAQGIDQHNIFSWEVEGDDFRHLAGLSDLSRAVHGISTAWLAQIDDMQKERIVRAIWEAVEASGAQNVHDVLAGGAQRLRQLVEATRHLDRGSGDVIAAALRDLANVAARYLGHDVVCALSWIWE